MYLANDEEARIDMHRPQRVDLVHDRPNDYATPTDPIWVRTTPGKVVAIDGEGAPGGDAFRESLQRLYGVAYTLKFLSKRSGVDFRLAPLEGLWWIGSGPPAGAESRWRLQIPVPSFVDRDNVVKAITQLESRRGIRLAGTVRLARSEGRRAVQLLHVGPYSAEGGDLARMATFAEDAGRMVEPWHVEIYLSDPRRVPPGRLRTILRRPTRAPGRPAARLGSRTGPEPTRRQVAGRPAPSTSGRARVRRSAGRPDGTLRRRSGVSTA